MENSDDIKRKELEKRYENIKQDIEKLNNQLNYTENARTKNNLEREINSLYEDLNNIVQEIETLEEKIAQKQKLLPSDTNININRIKKPISPNLSLLCNPVSRCANWFCF